MKIVAVLSKLIWEGNTSLQLTSSLANFDFKSLPVQCLLRREGGSRTGRTRCSPWSFPGL